MALQCDPCRSGNRICQQTQLACLKVAIHFHVQHLSGVHWTHPTHIPTRKKVTCYHFKTVFFPLNPIAKKIVDLDTSRNSYVILLSAFFPFSSLSDACVSSAVSLNSSLQQKILSEFFFCLLLSSSYLMGQNTTKYLAKC